MAAQRRHGAAPAENDAPASTVRRRAAQVIDEQRVKIFAHVAAAVDGRDPEGVHDMRVATRRLRACLKVFTPWLDAGELDRVAPAARSLTRALGRVRELDVLRLRLGELATTAAPQRALAIECVDARLARRRSRARARMMARFAKVDLDRLEGRLRRLTAQLARPGAPANADAATAATAPAGEAAAPAAAGTGGEPPIADLLTALAGVVLDEARAISCPSLPEQVGTEHAAEALHAVRIAAKKLRYTLEIVAPYLGDGGTNVVRRLRAVQDKLGDFHDDTVLDDTLRPEIERALERGRPLLAAELRGLRSSRRRALLRDERAVRLAIAQLREDDFVGLLAGALAAAGVVLPAAADEQPATAGVPAEVAVDASTVAEESGAPAPRRGRARTAAANAPDAG